jgi:hypothetical protein
MNGDSDEETKEDKASYAPNTDIVDNRKLSLMKALKDIYKGQINLGKAGQLNIDVDPLGQNKSASIEYTMKFGGGKRDK